jgi:hypothetical protein
VWYYFFMDTPGWLQGPIETFRTAPIYLSGALVSLSLATMNGIAAIEASSGAAEDINFTVAAIDIMAAGLSLIAVHKQSRFRDRIEGILSKRGFNDRVMSRTVPSYCGRQATRIACENTDYLEEYVALCQDQSEQARFAWLPPF